MPLYMTQNATVLQITPLHHADTCTLYAYNTLRFICWIQFRFTSFNLETKLACKILLHLPLFYMYRYLHSGELHSSTVALIYQGAAKKPFQT